MKEEHYMCYEESTGNVIASSALRENVEGRPGTIVVELDVEAHGFPMPGRHRWTGDELRIRDDFAPTLARQERDRKLDEIATPRDRIGTVEKALEKVIEHLGLSGPGIDELKLLRSSQERSMEGVIDVDAIDARWRRRSA